MRAGRFDSIPLLGAGGAIIAVACCAGLPLLGSIFGGLTTAVAIGVASGGVLVAAAIAIAVLAVRAGRRRNCAAPPKNVGP